MNQRQRDHVVGYLFMLPFLVSLTAFFLYAAVRTLVFSFTDYNLFNTPAFVGIANYLAMLRDSLFTLALSNTLAFSLIVTASQTALALLLAVQVNSVVKARGFWRTVFYLPSIMSSAAMTLIFLWLFQRQGLMTELVQFAVNARWYLVAFVAIAAVIQLALVLNARRRYDGISFGDPVFATVALLVALVATYLLRVAAALPVYDEELLISWLNTQARFLFLPQTLWSVALMNVFTTVPTFMLLFLAGLQSIPVALYEAAELDGAGKVRQFFYVTVPSLAPVTFAVVTLGIIGTLQMFDQVAILGDAAPLQSRVTLAFYIYANAFPEGAASRIGMSSAAAILLGVLTLIIVYLQRAFGITDRVDR
ncbi:MAG TPA: sugar ABC transporter permease [Devosia sp.]|jgi:multiple sugar transport system permease protein|nr:sugar ABC transporter permease [Devosia sp.]